MPTTSRRQRLTALLAATVLAASAAALTSTPAQADNDATLTVVGTSDVFDSFLVQTVIKPGFEARYPQYTLNYVSKGTGAAIQFAEAGTASALIVHAAALENQFVADGYSSETYGRAIFWGDYVLLGPASDPAGVMNGADHDVATAFEKIAAAGVNGTANFVSRGGTPGTTVQEHAIWALTNSSATLSKCDVASGSGGGQSPSTATGACGNPIAYPSWYHATGLTQGPNILAGDSCNFQGGGCYVLTDRGTFNYLQSTNQIQNLQIVTRDNSPQSRGGEPLLVNSFHAYGIDPQKFAGNQNVQINKAAADAFLSWITSPVAQAAIGNYLNGSADPPFLPSAAPSVTTSALPTATNAGSPFTITGFVTNVVPGTPVLDGIPVNLMGVPSNAPTRAPVRVAGATTNGSGQYTIRFVPTVNMSYSVTTGQVTKVEDAGLNPIFGDLLAPTTTQIGASKVLGKVAVTQRNVRFHRLRLRGVVSPRVAGSGGRLYLYAGRVGAPLSLKSVRALPAGAGSFDEFYRFRHGRWNYQVKVFNTGVVQPASTGVARVRIP